MLRKIIYFNILILLYKICIRNKYKYKKLREIDIELWLYMHVFLHLSRNSF